MWILSYKKYKFSYYATFLSVVGTILRYFGVLLIIAPDRKNALAIVSIAVGIILHFIAERKALNDRKKELSGLQIEKKIKDGDREAARMLYESAPDSETLKYIKELNPNIVPDTKNVKSIIVEREPKAFVKKLLYSIALVIVASLLLAAQRGGKSTEEIIIANRIADNAESYPYYYSLSYPDKKFYIKVCAAAEGFKKSNIILSGEYDTKKNCKAAAKKYGEVLIRILQEQSEYFWFDAESHFTFVQKGNNYKIELTPDFLMDKDAVEERTSAIAAVKSRLDSNISDYPIYADLTPEDKALYAKICVWVENFDRTKLQIFSSSDNKIECNSNKKVKGDLLSLVAYEQTDYFWWEPGISNVECQKTGKTHNHSYNLTYSMTKSRAAEKKSAIDKMKEKIESNISVYPMYESLSDWDRSLYLRVCAALESFDGSNILIPTMIKSPNKCYKNISERYEFMKKLSFEQAEYFWWNANEIRIVSEKDGSYYRLKLVNRYITDKESAMKMKKAFDKKVDFIVKKASKQKTKFDKILYVYDYIIKSTTYDYAMSKKIKNGKSVGINYLAYGCLVKGKTVCAGYTAGFNLIMQRLGFACGVEANNGHCWSYCKIDGDYYYFDLTWDDTDSQYKNSHIFFAVTRAEFIKSHYDYKCEIDAKSEKYDYYVHKGLYFRKYDYKAVKKAIIKNSDKSQIILKFANGTETKKAERELIDKLKISDILPEYKKVTWKISDGQKHLMMSFE